MSVLWLEIFIWQIALDREFENGRWLKWQIPNKWEETKRVKIVISFCNWLKVFLSLNVLKRNSSNLARCRMRILSETRLKMSARKWHNERKQESFRHKSITFRLLRLMVKHYCWHKDGRRNNIERERESDRKTVSNNKRDRVREGIRERERGREGVRITERE